MPPMGLFLSAGALDSIVFQGTALNRFQSISIPSPGLRASNLMGKATAVTAQLPVAEEAQITAELMGNEVDAINDIGVAGIHRLMSNRERFAEARVIVVCAGMEGALQIGRASCRVRV